MFVARFTVIHRADMTSAQFRGHCHYDCNECARVFYFQWEACTHGKPCVVGNAVYHALHFSCHCAQQSAIYTDWLPNTEVAISKWSISRWRGQLMATACGSFKYAQYRLLTFLFIYSQRWKGFKLASLLSEINHLFKVICMYKSSFQCDKRINSREYHYYLG